MGYDTCPGVLPPVIDSGAFNFATVAKSDLLSHTGSILIEKTVSI